MRIGRDSILGDDVTVGPKTRIDRDALIGDGVNIGANVQIDRGVQIEAGAEIGLACRAISGISARLSQSKLVWTIDRCAARANSAFNWEKRYDE